MTIFNFYLGGNGDKCPSLQIKKVHGHETRFNSFYLGGVKPKVQSVEMSHPESVTKKNLMDFDICNK